MDVAVYVFALLAFGVYPLIYDDHYFNITITKYHFFLYAAGIYLALALIGYVVEANLKNYYKYDSLLVEDTGKKRFLRPEFYALAFLMANFFAWLCADNKKMLLWLAGQTDGPLHVSGSDDRIRCVGTACASTDDHVYLFAAANAFAYAVAIGQHMEHDFLNLRYNIASNQYTKFISTFGNINMYASYLSISIPVLLAVFAFCKNWFSRILSGILLIAAGCNILIANSDSVFLGILLALLW